MRAPKRGWCRLDADTSMSPGTFEAALRAIGGAVMATDEVMTAKVHNAFCAMRPPGHHAETVRPMGFCFFNTAAIIARHARKTYGAERVAVVDFDVHHGNGTQEIFWSDPTVMYCSTHENAALSGHRRAVRVEACTTTSSTRRYGRRRRRAVPRGVQP